jgi:hypothetical protein
MFTSHVLIFPCAVFTRLTVVHLAAKLQFRPISKTRFVFCKF